MLLLDNMSSRTLDRQFAVAICFGQGGCAARRRAAVCETAGRTVIGLALAVAVMGVLRRLLYDVTPFDGLTLVLGA